MLQFILWYSFIIFIFHHLYSQSFFIHLLFPHFSLKLFQKDVNCKQINISIVVFLLTDQINLFMSFIYLFSFYLAFITRKYVSIEKRICFKKKLTVARDQLPKNIPVTYFPYSFLCRLGRVNVTFLNLPVMTVCGVNFNNSRSTIPV